MSTAGFGNVKDMSGVIWECLGISEGVCGKLEGIRGAERGVWQSFPFICLQFYEVTDLILDIFQ